MNINKHIDILCVGEALVDFIGHQHSAGVNETRDYHRYLGGSPTNLAMNAARLGLNTTLIATIGEDGFGEYIMKRLKEVNINTDHIKRKKAIPTSTVFISRSLNTPDFIAYRTADYHIKQKQIPTETLKQTRVFHTTCFALSKKPAQTTILEKAKEAFNLGCKLSIDINYSKKLWKSKKEANKIIKTYCKFNPLVKVSEDDMFRFFGKELYHEKIFEFFHNEGVETVCLTLGSKGVKLSQKKGGIIELPAIKVEKVRDTTGAGDAFWSGFLFAYIKGVPYLCIYKTCI